MKRDAKVFKPGRKMIFIGVFLIAAALLLSGKNLWDIGKAEIQSQAALSELRPMIEESKPFNRYEEKVICETMDSEGSDEIMEVAVIPDYILNPEMEMPTKHVDGKQYIGIIEIPEIDLELPIMESWSYENLKTSPCRYYGTAYRKNLVICAHNYEVHFGNIKYLDVGSEVYFTDADGNVFRYEVAEVETLKPTAIEEMTTSDWDLTLFTCTIGGASRVTVRCELQ